MERLKGIFLKNGVVSKLLILIGITLFFTILGILVWSMVAVGNQTDISALKLMQLFQSVGMFVIPPFVFAYFCSRNTGDFLCFRRRINLWLVVQVIFFMILIIPAINLLAALNQQLVLPDALSGVEAGLKASEEQVAQLTRQFLNVHGLPALAFNIFLMAIIPALGEELFFRGALQGIFRQKMKVVAAIWFAAVVFSAIHMQFYGFVPRMILGAFFGYLLYWSGNIWLPIIAHFINNVIAVVFYYLKYNGYQLADIDAIGTGTTLWLGCTSAVLCIAGFFWLKKQFRIYNNLSVES